MWIHIADPTRWVASPHSPLAEEAAQRSKSVYLPTGAPALAGSPTAAAHSRPHHRGSRPSRCAPMPGQAVLWGGLGLGLGCCGRPPAVARHSVGGGARRERRCERGGVRRAGVIPMFPYQLAQGPFSLRSGAGPTAALSIGVVLGADGSVEEYTVAPSLVEPRARLTYRQAGFPRPSLPLPAPPLPISPCMSNFVVLCARWRPRGGCSSTLPDACSHCVFRIASALCE